MMQLDSKKTSKMKVVVVHEIYNFYSQIFPKICLYMGDSNCARIFLFISLTCVFLYNYCFPFTLQTRCLAQLVEDVYCKHWDLGSIPRSPHILNDFCFNTFTCSASPTSHHTASRIACQVALVSNLKATE